MFRVAAFYRFRRLADPPAIRERLLPALRGLGVKGSVLLAAEGVNGTIAGTPDTVEHALQEIAGQCALPALECRNSHSDTLPFLRMKVRLKKEIVTIGDVPSDPNRVVGEYVAPKDWNALIADPGTILVDVRNDYEHRVGTFLNATTPGTASFSEFPGWAQTTLGGFKQRRIATFCTGGIRCEKATSFMRLAGFEDVYQLEGGILKYLEEVPASRSRWQGGCFVFDGRVAVGHGLQPLDFSICHGCLMPVSASERLSSLYEEGVCCPACATTLSERQRSSNRERQKQHALSASRGTRHIGPKEG